MMLKMDRSEVLSWIKSIVLAIVITTAARYFSLQV